MRQDRTMCRNIRPLFNFDPPATDDEVRAAAVQFVDKLAGFTKPSQANEAALDRAVGEITHTARHLMDSLVTSADPRQREAWAVRAKERSNKRFAPRANTTS